MKKQTFVFIALLVLAILAIVALAATMTDTAGAAGDCHEPLRPALYLALVSQNHIAGMIDCIQHPYKCLDY